MTLFFYICVLKKDEKILCYALSYDTRKFTIG